MISYISKRKIRSSKEQLEIDFGFGYRSILDENKKFKIKSLTRMTKTITSYFFIIDLLMGRHDPDILDKVVSENEMIRDFIERISVLDSTFNANGDNRIYGFFRNSILISSVSFSLLRNLVKNKKNSGADNNVYGCYIPTKRYLNCIFLANSDRMTNVISHEHIHFLQFWEKNRNPNFSNLNLDVIFDDEVKNDENLKYLTKRLEVEARFHEVIIAFYRRFKKIPTNVNDFFDLLHRLPNDYFEYSNLILKLKSSKNNGNYERLEIRDGKSAEDLDFIVLSCKDEDVSFRFLIEVLPVIYANLLFYYGYESESANFSEQITRPNLYDELYGV